MKTISSRQNPEVKAVDSLKKAKERKKQQRFVAEGLRTVQTILTRFDPVRIYVTQHVLHQNNMHIPYDIITVVSDQVMRKMSSAKTPPGILGVFHIPQQDKPSLTPGIVLAHIQNPGNMGTLIRTAAAMNAQTCVIIEGTDVWGPKVVQASAGTLAYINIIQLNWQQLLALKKDIPLCALVVKGGKPPRELPLETSLIIIGNEAEGIPSDWVSQCKQLCTLPMPGGTESLNAAVAGSITLYIAYT